MKDPAELHDESGNDEGRATVLNGLGNTYGFLGQFDKALEYFQESLEVRERIGDMRGVSVALNNIALIHFYQGEFAEAI